MAGGINISEELYHFVEDNKNDYYSMQVILFFTDHPYARFNELAIIQALNQDGDVRLIKQALGNLVGMGILKTWMGGGATLFSLIENMRSLASELNDLDVHQQQRLLESHLTEKRQHISQHLAAAPVLIRMPNITSAGNQEATIPDSAEHQSEKYELVGVK